MESLDIINFDRTHKFGSFIGSIWMEYWCPWHQFGPYFSNRIRHPLFRPIKEIIKGHTYMSLTFSKQKNELCQLIKIKFRWQIFIESFQWWRFMTFSRLKFSIISWHSFDFHCTNTPYLLNERRLFDLMCCKLWILSKSTEPNFNIKHSINWSKCNHFSCNSN